MFVFFEPLYDDHDLWERDKKSILTDDSLTHVVQAKQRNSEIELTFFLRFPFQFRNLLEQRTPETPTQLIRCNKCPPGCSDTCTLHPVQQGEVSSTEPPLAEPSINGHSPEKSAYFEAVQHYLRNVGWALLEINSDGCIEYATDNVIDVLHYSRQELSGQSIYSYLHTGDHNKVSPILDKNFLNFEWVQDDGPVSLLKKNHCQQNL